MIRKQVLILLMLINGVGLLSAQNSLSLSVDSAQNYALQYNKMHLNSALAVDEAKEKVREAIASGLPQVDAAMDYSNFMGAEMELRFMEGAPPNKIPFKPTSNLNVSIGQLVFSGSYFVGVQTAKLFAEVSKTNYEKSEQEIREQVIRSYFLAMTAEKSRGIVQRNLENIQEIYQKTEALFQVGMAEQTDLDQLSVQVVMLENGLRSADRQVSLSYNMLRLQLGVGIKTNIQLTESLEDMLMKNNTENLLATSFVVGENLDFQLMQMQEKLSEKQVDMEKAAYLPSVSAFYQYTTKILKPEFDMSPKNVVGLKMNIPVFSSGKRKSKLDQAKIRLQSTQNTRELLADQLLIQENQLKFNLNNAVDQYNSQKHSVEVSQRVFDNIRMKFEQGMRSSLDLTTANSNLLQAETAYINSLMQLLDAYTALNKLYGKL